MKRKALLLTIAIIVFTALGSLASLWVLNRSMELLVSRNIKALVDDVNQLQNQVYEVLLEQDPEALNELSSKLDSRFESTRDQITASYGTSPQSTHGYLNALRSQLKPFKDAKETITQSVGKTISIQQKIKDLEFDFVGGFVDFLGSKNALRLPENQVALSESIMAILRAQSEKEFVSARLLFQSTLSDYSAANIVTADSSRELAARFFDYAKLKEDLFTTRKERSYLVQDMIQILTTMRTNISSFRTNVESAVSQQIDQLRIWFIFACIVLSLLFFTIIQAQIKKNLFGPILTLKTASLNVSNGDFRCVEGIKQDDEIGELSHHFNNMVKKLNESVQSERLRTNQILAIINNVTAAFCMVDETGTVQPGFTRSCNAMFGEEFDSGKTITSILRLQKRDAEHFRLMIEQAFEECFDDDTAIAQLPKEFTYGNKWLGIESRIVRREDNSISGILLTIVDKTLLKFTKEQAELNKILVFLAIERQSFGRFITEFRNTMGELPTLLRSRENSARVKHLLHTLKGNFSVFGLKDLAGLIHTLESKESLNALDIYKIKEAFKGFLAEHEEVLKLDYNSESDNTLEIDREDLDALEQRITGELGRDAATLRNTVLKWLSDVQMRKAAEYFSALPILVKKLNERFQKGVHYEFEGGQILVDPQRFLKLAQVIPHLVRNSFDHGIESPEARAKAGKAETPVIRLAITNTEECITVTVSDNGGGINSGRLFEKAIQAGHLEADVSLTEEDKLNLIFLDDLSAKDTVSDISGRGVGMSAVKFEVETLGGSIRVLSKRGEGTSMEMRFPHERTALKIA